MALSTGGERSEPTRGESQASAGARRAVGGARRRASNRQSAADVALRLAVETLSAEICWFVANDAGARGVFAAATAEPNSPRPSP
jgi:hypothetical protein